LSIANITNLGENSGTFPLLDNNLQNSTYKTTNRRKQIWSTSQKNAFLRVKSGITVHKGERLRFLTLTSAPKMIRSLQETFDCMKTRIKNYTPNKIKKEGYVSKNKISFYYPNKNPFEKLKFEYIKIKTTEANGVLHILYFGDYIPYNLLCDLFSYYTGFAWDLDIRQVKTKPGSNKDRKKLAYYVMNQYVTGQTDQEGNSAYSGYSSSWNWIFKGFTKWYDQYRKDYRHLDYNERNEIINQFLIKKRWIPPPKQQLLDDYDPEGSFIETRNSWKGKLRNA
jgi:hypothetical protein